MSSYWKLKVFLFPFSYSDTPFVNGIFNDNHTAFRKLTSAKLDSDQRIFLFYCIQ